MSRFQWWRKWLGGWWMQGDSGRWYRVALRKPPHWDTLIREDWEEYWP